MANVRTHKTVGTCILCKYGWICEGAWGIIWGRVCAGVCKRSGKRKRLLNMLKNSTMKLIVKESSRGNYSVWWAHMNGHCTSRRPGDRRHRMTVKPTCDDIHYALLMPFCGFTCFELMKNMNSREIWVASVLYFFMLQLFYEVAYLILSPFHLYNGSHGYFNVHCEDYRYIALAPVGLQSLWKVRITSDLRSSGSGIIIFFRRRNEATTIP